jgi:hypothetical protein
VRSLRNWRGVGVHPVDLGKKATEVEKVTGMTVAMEEKKTTVEGMYFTGDKCRVVTPKTLHLSHALPPDIIAGLMNGLMTCTGEVGGDQIVSRKAFPHPSIPETNAVDNTVITTETGWTDLHHRPLRMVIGCFRMSKRRRMSPTKYSWI